MIDIDDRLTVGDFDPLLVRFWSASSRCIDSIESRLAPHSGSPVFTVGGRYTARGWTEWTQGFQFGSAILQFDAAGEKRFLELGRQRTALRWLPT